MFVCLKQNKIIRKYVFLNKMLKIKPVGFGNKTNITTKIFHICMQVIFYKAVSLLYSCTRAVYILL